MSFFLSGGGRAAYGMELEIIKSTSSSSIRTSHSSSQSSTISESSNSPLAISTRKPRTRRKRPNQTYNEAAALLSTAYPKIFSKPCKFINPHEYSSSFEGELLLPEKPVFQIHPSAPHAKPCSNDTQEIGCQTNSSDLCSGYDDCDFDAESILDEEIEEGVIDSIMGNSGVCSDVSVNFCYGYPLGLGFGLSGRFDFGFGMVRGGLGLAKAFRQSEEPDWWTFPTVDVGEISPRFNKISSQQKMKNKAEKENSTPVPKSSSAPSKENSNLTPKSISKSSPQILLKLNYDEVLNAWSDRGSPFSEEFPGSEISGSDTLARLAQIDLFGDTGASREASVQRYKEKRRTRLFSKKIRYEVRKVNADPRPRMKGRFVRRPNSSGSEDIQERRRIGSK